MIATYFGDDACPLLWGGCSATRDLACRASVRWVLFSLVPATLFFIVTNFAVWAFESSYEKSFAGLAKCYWAAVPFYRWMLAGDLFYLSVLLACFALAGMTRRDAAALSVSTRRLTALFQAIPAVAALCSALENRFFGLIRFRLCGARYRLVDRLGHCVDRFRKSQVDRILASSTSDHRLNGGEHCVHFLLRFCR